jgi:hypothetical protein
MVKLIGGLVNVELDHSVYYSLENNCGDLNALVADTADGHGYALDEDIVV